MIRKDQQALVFLTAILLSSVIISPYALDPCLTARFIVLSCGLLIITVLWYRGWVTPEIQTDWLSLSFGAYVLFSCLASFWSLNFSEALFDNSRLLLSYAVFLLAGHFIKIHGEEFTVALQRVSFIIFLIALAVFLYQVSQGGLMKKNELYDLTGLNAHKNLFSSFLFLQLYFLYTGFRDQKGQWKFQSLVYLFLALGIICLLRTKSVWIGIITVLLVYAVLFIIRNKRFKKSVLIALGLLALVIMNFFFMYALPKVLDMGLQPVTTNNVQSSLLAKVDEERLMLWDKSYHSIEKYPIAGVGPGNWQVYFPDATLSGIWRAEDLNFTFQRPHNDFLWILSETGYVGLNLYLVFLIFLFMTLLQAIQSVADPKTKNRLALCFAFIPGYLVISFFDFPRERIEHIAWFSLLLALARNSALTAGALKPLRSYRFSPSMMLGAVFLFLILSLTGYYRHRGESYTRKLYDKKREGNVEQVIRLGKRAESFAYTLDPTSVPLSWYLGNSYATKQDYKEALKELTRAKKQNPYNRNVLNDLASALVFMGRVDSAKVLYKEAARISPRFDEAILNMAAVLIQERNFEEADLWLRSLKHDSERRAKYEAVVKDALGQQ